MFASRANRRQTPHHDSKNPSQANEQVGYKAARKTTFWSVNRLFASKMKTRVEFKSSAFPKYESEDDETVNPNRWGKRLAEFIRDNLPTYGILTEDILCEDWGWLVNTKNDEFSVWIGCGPVEDFFDGDEENYSSPTSQASSSGLIEFCVFVTAEPSFFKKLFKRIDTAPAVSRVVASLERMIADREEFQDAEWSE